jgi:hypothetical protein
MGDFMEFVPYRAPSFEGASGEIDIIVESDGIPGKVERRAIM